jgi:hypothetical protein
MPQGGLRNRRGRLRLFFAERHEPFVELLTVEYTERAVYKDSP